MTSSTMFFFLPAVRCLSHFRIMTFSIQQAKRFYYRLGKSPLRAKAGTGCPNVGIINDTPSVCLPTSPGPAITGCYNNFLHPSSPPHARTLKLSCMLYIYNIYTYTKATLLIIAIYILF